MKKVLVTLAALSLLTGCADNAQPVSTPANPDTQPSSNPAAAVKNIKKNVQGTLDQIKLRDQNLQDLANGEDE